MSYRLPEIEEVTPSQNKIDKRALSRKIPQQISINPLARMNNAPPSHGTPIIDTAQLAAKRARLSDIRNNARTSSLRRHEPG